MLHTISWSTYFEIIGLILIAYYAIIAIVFYRRDFEFILTHRSTFQQPIAIPQVKEFDHEVHQSKTAVTQENIDLFFPDANNFSAVAESLIDELKAFTLSSGTDYNKVELINALQKLLKRYFVLKESPFQTYINIVIANECENNCSIVLSEEELSVLWNG